MKKVLMLVLVLVFILSLGGCQADNQVRLENDDVTDAYTFIVINVTEQVGIL